MGTCHPINGHVLHAQNVVPEEDSSLGEIAADAGEEARVGVDPVDGVCKHPASVLPASTHTYVYMYTAEAYATNATVSCVMVMKNQD